MKSKIKISTKEGVIVLNPKKIVYCETSERFAVIHKSDQSLLKTMLYLKELHSRLPKERFFRIHAKYLVNGDAIERYNLKNKEIVIKGIETPLPLAHDRCHEFNLWIEQHITAEEEKAEAIPPIKPREETEGKTFDVPVMNAQKDSTKGME